MIVKMKNPAVLIFDLDKLTKEEWKHLACDNDIMRSVYRIEESSIEKVEEFLDILQEEELEEKNKI